MKKQFRFGILGHPVKHSLSPVMHQASFRALGIQGDYTCLDTPPKTLSKRLETCRKEGFDGLNITVPLKEKAVSLMDRLDDSARLYGAVNTVRFTDQGVIGFNTDAEGFLADLHLGYHQSPLARHVLILGCGGAGRALAIACAKKGANTLLLADQDAARAERLAHDLARLFPDISEHVQDLPANPEKWIQACKTADLIVHCTPLGLHADDAPALPPEAFRPGQFLYDIVYTTRITPTMRAALNSGADAVNGCGMLIRQGAASFTIWTGMTADVPAMRTALEKAIYGS